MVASNRNSIRCCANHCFFAMILCWNFLSNTECCGPGGGAGQADDGGGVLIPTSQNNDQGSSGLAEIKSWLPASVQGLRENVLINYLDDNIKKTFGNIKSETYFDGTQGKIISCPSDLDCSFEDDKECRWKNSRQDNLDYYLSRGRPDIDKWEIYLGTRQKPKEPFLTVAGNKGNYRALLISDRIKQQDGDGVLKFKLWTTPLVEFRVCTRNPSSTTFNFCTETVDRNVAPGPAKFTIPGPINNPFEIVIETKNFVTSPGGIAFIDDIEYSASTACIARDPGSNNFVEKQLKFAKPRTTTTTAPFFDEQDSTDICGAIPCDFEGGNCGYSFNSTKGTQKWRIENKPVGNRATGIQKDIKGVENFINSYVLAAGRNDGANDLYVFESQPFLLNRPIFVSFYKHIMSTPAQLRVCLINFTYCPGSYQVNVTEKGWHEAVVEFRPESIPLEFQNRPVTLLFVTEGLKQNNYVGVDNVHVLSQGFFLC